MTEQEKGNLHQVSVEIGGLKSSVEMLMRVWQTQEAAATAGRRALYEKFDLFQQSVGVQIASLSLRIDRVVDEMKLIEPAVDGFKAEKLRKEGAERFGVKIYAALAAAAGALGWIIHEFGDRLFAWLRNS
jgi:hypothetical protein